MERPATRLQHAGELLLADAGDTLRAGDDAWLVGQPHRGLHVSVFDRLPVLLLQIQQLRFDRPFSHLHPRGRTEIDWRRMSSRASL